MVSDVIVVLVSVGLAVAGFVTLIVVCAVVLRLIEVVLPTDKPVSETPVGPVTEPDRPDPKPDQPGPEPGEPDPESPIEPHPGPGPAG